MKRIAIIRHRRAGLNLPYYIILVSLLVTGIAFADDGARQFELGAGNYKRGHYGRSLYHFEKALAAGLKDEKKEAAQYGVDVLKRYSPELAGIEKEEARLRGSGDRAALKELSARHWLFARKLMIDKFYLIMVAPHLERAVGLDPDNIEAYFDLGNACYAAMQYTKAVRNYREVIRRSAGMLWAYKMAGDACVAVGDFDRAKRFYSDLIKANKGSLLKYPAEELDKVKATLNALPETYKDIDRLFKEERFDEAEIILKKRLSLNSADYIAMTALGSIYQDRGDRKTALKLYKQAMKIAPDYPIAHLYLGRLYYLMRKPEEAIAEFDAFKAKMKNLPNMDSETRKMYVNDLYYLIEVYSTLEQYGDVKREIDEILKIDPKSQDAHYCLGVYHYVHEHNRSRAYQSFKKTIDIEPGSDTAKRAEYAIDYIRNNPDSRLVPDFSFIDRD